MKFLVQSDDYGITRACALGAIEGIKNGVIRNTGMFTNMPWAEECADLIRPYLDKIALGVDLNASTGTSILGHDKLPSLTHEDGSFLTSRENRALDTEENNHDHVVYEEVYAEFEAQIERYMELFGKKPDYLHGHAYGTATTIKASMDLARKYGCVYSSAVQTLPDVHNGGMGWYAYGGGLETQLNEKPLEFIMNNADEYLKHDYVYLICHCGYVDAEIFKLSSFNVCRAIDLECMTSDSLKNWVKDNNVELISFNDVKDEWFEKIDWDKVPVFSM